MLRDGIFSLGVETQVPIRTYCGSNDPVFSILRLAVSSTSLEMSLPRLLAQVLFLGTQIVGKAFLEAGRQAARNARAGRVDAGGAAAGNTATGNSVTDGLSRLHRMTLDEAKLILNMKQATEAEKEQLIKNYEHLFATNAPPAPKGKNGGGSGSFYVQSKIVRARERIEAEWKEVAKAFEQQKANKEQASANPPPPPPPPAS